MTRDRTSISRNVSHRLARRDLDFGALGWPRVECGTVHEKHVRARARLPELPRLGVLRRAPPVARRLGVLELEDDEALRLPRALEWRGRPAAHEVLPSVLGDGRRRERLVALV